THLVMATFATRAGLELVHVPFKGNGPATSAVLGNQIEILFGGLPPLLPHVATGRLRPLAISSGKRSASAPNVPTVAESGFPGYEGYLWIGAIAPAKTPTEAIATLSAAFAKAVNTPKVADRLRADGVEVVGSTPEQFGKIIADELKLWARVVRDAKITVSE
ncbi:MAG: tripartite tricarboxylate transporter substrate-binding protein, partial [Bacteroidota bacterium]